MTEALYTYNTYHSMYDSRQEMPPVWARMGTAWRQDPGNVPEVQIPLLEQGAAEEEMIPKDPVKLAEWRRKQSESHKIRWQDPEYRKKCSDSHKGKHPSAESIQKRIATITGHITPEETRRKISTSLKGKKHPIERVLKNRITQKICKNSPEARQKQSIAASKRIGPNAGNWRGGISFEPYCPKFNNEFKERVRAFFGNKCVECGSTQNGVKLSVHHVNFRKDACCTDSVIPLFVPLCPSCHSKTQKNRPFWQYWFTEMINHQYGGKCYLPKKEVE